MIAEADTVYDRAADTLIQRLRDLAPNLRSPNGGNKAEEARRQASGWHLLHNSFINFVRETICDAERRIGAVDNKDMAIFHDDPLGEIWVIIASWELYADKRDKRASA